MLTRQGVENAILVLSYQLYDNGTMQEPFRRRIRIAGRLHHNNKTHSVITSGWRPLTRLDLGKYCEAQVGAMALTTRLGLGQNEAVFTEEDSTCIPENLLFTRAVFENLKGLKIVTALHALERTEYLAEMIFAGNAEFKVIGCRDGVGDPESERLMIGNARCIFATLAADPKVKFKPGQWQKLMRPSVAGRMQSCWQELLIKHQTCEWYQKLHPSA